jgi:hypothetical protein
MSQKQHCKFKQGFIKNSAMKQQKPTVSRRKFLTDTTKAIRRTGSFGYSIQLF